MCKDERSIIDLNTESRVRKGLSDRALNFQRFFFFRHTQLQTWNEVEKNDLNSNPIRPSNAGGKRISQKPTHHRKYNIRLYIVQRSLSQFIAFCARQIQAGFGRSGRCRAFPKPRQPVARTRGLRTVEFPSIDLRITNDAQCRNDVDPNATQSSERHFVQTRPNCSRRLT